MPNYQNDFINEVIHRLPDAKAIKKRTLIIDNFSKTGDYYDPDEEKLGYHENYNGHGSDRYYWEDGSGTEANIIFKADGINDDAILMFVYDHESSFNTFSASYDQIVFEGIPEKFKYLLQEDNLKWDWDTSDKKVVYATAAVWTEHDSTTWEYSEPFFAKLKDEETNDSGGFLYPFEAWLVPATKKDLGEALINIGLAEDAKDLRSLVI